MIKLVREYYADRLIRISEQELEKVLKVIEPPAALIGGWAVHFHVNDKFKEEQARDYIGSRDIDLGFKVDPTWKPSEIKEKAVGRSLRKIEELSCTKSRFGYEVNFHRETMNRLTEDDAKKLPMHQIFTVSVDILPDNQNLRNFEEAFGFQPPAEPLLKHVFEKERAKILKEYVVWELSDSVFIPNPEVLAVMKICSLPDREKGHKRAKDLADLYSILWYTEPYEEIREKVESLAPHEKLVRLEKSLNNEIFESAANLLRVEIDLIRSVINRLSSV